MGKPGVHDRQLQRDCYHLSRSALLEVPPITLHMKSVRLWTLTALLGCAGLTEARTLDTCFSPQGHCDQVLVTWINASQKTLEGAIYGLTDLDIAQAFVRAKQRGVQVRLVHDKTQAAGKHDITDELARAGIEVHVQRGSEGGILHHKFLIIDSTYVVTGSFNWTNNATSKNDENFVVLDDQTPKFKQEFERLWTLPPAPAPRTRVSHPYFGRKRPILVVPWETPVYQRPIPRRKRRRKPRKNPFPPPVVITPILS